MSGESGQAPTSGGSGRAFRSGFAPYGWRPVAAQDTALLTRLVRDLVAGLRTSDVETVTYGAATHAELRAAQAATALLIGPSSTRTVTGPDDLEPHVLHFAL